MSCRCSFWHSLKCFDQNPSRNAFQPIYFWSRRARCKRWLDGSYVDSVWCLQWLRLSRMDLVISVWKWFLFIHSSSCWSSAVHRACTPSPWHWKTWSGFSLSCTHLGQFEWVWYLYFTSIVPTPQNPVVLHSHCCSLRVWLEVLLALSSQSTFCEVFSRRFFLSNSSVVYLLW